MSVVSTFYNKFTVSGSTKSPEAKAILLFSWSCFVTRSSVLRMLTATERTAFHLIEASTSRSDLMILL